MWKGHPCPQTHSILNYESYYGAIETFSVGDAWRKIWPMPEERQRRSPILPLSGNWPYQEMDNWSSWQLLWATTCLQDEPGGRAVGRRGDGGGEGKRIEDMELVPPDREKCLSSAKMARILTKQAWKSGRRCARKDWATVRLSNFGTEGLVKSGCLLNLNFKGLVSLSALQWLRAFENLLGFTRTCCGFLDINVKKCVNVCRDKIWQNSAKICRQNVKFILKLWQFYPSKNKLCQFYVVKRSPEWYKSTT